MTSKHKAIIFDCFGVLVEASLEPFIRKYLGHDEDKANEAIALDQLASKGKIRFEQQLKEYSRLAGVSLTEVKEFMESNPRNEPLLTYIATELKPKYKIGMLSNASENWLDELFIPGDIALFDSVTLSYDTGYAKPEAQIYEIAVDRLGVRLDECIFVDDRQEYVDGATHVGMTGVIYQNMEHFTEDLNHKLAEG